MSSTQKKYKDLMANYKTYINNAERYMPKTIDRTDLYHIVNSLINEGQIDTDILTESIIQYQIKKWNKLYDEAVSKLNK